MVSYGAWSSEVSASTLAATIPVPPVGVPTFAQRTHTVSATASGSGSGTDASPWTLKQAMANATPGMIIGVKTGIYVGTDPLPGEPLHDGNPYSDTPGVGASERRTRGGFEITRSGTAASPIYFVAEVLASLSTDIAKYSWIRSGATLVGRGWPSIAIKAKYVEVIGFYISDRDCEDSYSADDSGRIVIWGPTYTNIAVRYCRFFTTTKHQNYQWTWPHPTLPPITNNDSSLRLEACSYITESDNYFEQDWTKYVNNQTHQTHYQAFYITIEYNYFKNGTNAVFQKRGFGAGGVTGQPMKGVRFRHNVCEGVAASIYITGLRDDGPSETDRSHYYGNLFLYPRTEVVKMGVDNVTEFPHGGLRLFNNTIIHQDTAGYGVMDLASVSHESLYNNPYAPPDRANAWYNNIVSVAKAYANLGYNAHDGDLCDGAWWKAFMKSQNNCYEGIAAMWISGASNSLPLSTYTWAQLVAAGCETNSIAGPALMLDANGRLLAGSPCINAGKDLLGTYGPVNGTIDAGCYAGGKVPGIRSQ